MQENSNKALQKNKALSIRIVVIIALLAVIGITYFSVSALADSGYFVYPTVHEVPDFEFSNADFDYDIFSDEDYLEMIRNGLISHSDGATKVTLTEDDYDSYSEAAQLIFTLVHAIQNGDPDAYNACFSDAYLKKSGKQEAFTMQEIYEVIVVEDFTVREGDYLRTDFELEYKIRNNNGTLRDDMGSDASKKQYVTVTTNNKKGIPLIDSITVVNTEFKENTEAPKLNTANIATVSVVAFLVNSVAIFFAALAFVKTKNIRCK